MIKGDRRLIKQNEKLLNLLRFYKGIDRSELSRKLHVSMPTIYGAIDSLEKEKIIIKSGNGIILNEKYGTLIGISIGGSLCKVSFLDLNYQIFDVNSFRKHKENLGQKIDAVISNKKLLNECRNDQSRNYIYFNTPKTFQELKNILNNIFEYIQECVNDNILNVLCIGISCTGIINNATQTILSAHNLTYLDNSTVDTLIYPDKQFFFNNNDISVALVQNSDASVIAEKIYLYISQSIYAKKKNIVSLYLGVGIGAGIYLNGLYSGTSGFSGEIGHTKAYSCESPEDIEMRDTLVQNGSVDLCCTCGQDDCYDYKMRTFVFGTSTELFCDMPSDKIRAFLSEHSHRAELFGKYLGNMVNTLTSLLNVDLIIFTGKFYKSMDLLMNHIVSVQDENPLKLSRNDCTIISSNYGSLAPSVGAAIYAYHKKYGLDLSWDY